MVRFHSVRWRLLVLTIHLLAVAGVASRASAQPKTLRLQAVVTGVSADSVSVTARGGTTATFVVDSRTKIIRATAQAIPIPPAEGRSLTDRVRKGDRVTVTYREIGGAKYAATIRVSAAPTPR